MKEIEAYRYGHQGLNKVHTNDRSMPIIPNLPEIEIIQFLP